MLGRSDTGGGPDKIANLDGRRPYIAPRYAWRMDDRDNDGADMDALLAASVQYVALAALRHQGLAACTAVFLAVMAAQELGGFWFYFGVDLLAHELMPAVDSPQPGGLTNEELATLLIPLLQSGQVVGLDITILDASLDPTGAITRRFVAGPAPIVAVFTNS